MMKRMQYSGYNKRFRYEPQGYMHSRKWRRKMNLESNDCITQNHGGETKGESWKKIKERIGTNEAGMNQLSSFHVQKVNIIEEITGNIGKSKLKITFPPYYCIRPFAEFLLFTIWVIFLKASTGAANMSIKPLYGQTIYITSFTFLY